eukprot:GHVS01104172.1.p1 GENE.GHVS01104172.1~~GHVS01104172.1.p1  ORF type:complete len:254 (+),score=60.23 GHVS01104172.1:48-809(+)
MASSQDTPSPSSPINNNSCRVSVASSTSSVSPQVRLPSSCLNSCLSQEEELSSKAIEGFFTELGQLVSHVQTAARSIVETVSLPPLCHPSSSPTMALLQDKLGRARWLQEEVERLQRGQELSLEEILKALHDLHAANELSIAKLQRHFADKGHPITTSLLTAPLEAILTPTATHTTPSFSEISSCRQSRGSYPQPPLLPSPLPPQPVVAAPRADTQMALPDFDSLGLSAHTLQLLSAKPTPQRTHSSDYQMDD